jgi:hypothetical protein
MTYPPVDAYSNVRVLKQYPRGNTNNRTAQRPAVQAGLKDGYATHMSTVNRATGSPTGKTLITVPSQT